MKRAKYFIVCLALGAFGATTTAAAPVTCERNVVITGYWPPTNEMLRQWSTNPAQNPGTWQGSNWRGHGFNVYAYFPEYGADRDPFDNDFGSEGFIGDVDADFRVDYQDTSADFWRIMDEQRPIILITTSRGGTLGWEVEAIEGGHGSADGSPSQDWSSDGNGDIQPEKNTIDARSWEAISTYRAEKVLTSSLPMDEIVAATGALGLTSVAIDATGTSGNYLSGFMGLHGVYYHLTNAHNVAAGHIHVGKSVSNLDAEQLMETTLEVVLKQFEAATLACSSAPSQ